MKYRFVLIILFGFSGTVYSQLQFYPISHSQLTSSYRTAADSVQVNIPFWDDFSESHMYADTALWLDSENIQIQSGIGIFPPSVNVATFDGTDQFGTPYGNLPTEAGIGDSLVSRFIDLSSADQSSTYLSFYYQKEGRGELPDEDDYLRLLIKNDTNTWVEVWRVAGRDLDVQDEFFFELIPIDLPGYFHEYFQFKFESFGRLAGAFDNWHVDYIYLNDNRRGEILDLSDHTIINPPTPFFKSYTSVPYDQFMSDPGLYLDSSSVDLYNIENEKTNIGTTFELRYSGTGERIARIDSVVELGTNIQPFERRTFNSSVPNPDIFDGLPDSLYLTSYYYINTGDTIDIVNLRANDTVSMNFSIHEELAYDDGTAEFSAGLDGIGAELAYQFYTPIEDQVTGLKIYFPNVNTGSSGNIFVIKVWDELSDEGTSEIYSLSATRQIGGLNEFAYYPFTEAVSVSDTFYVGYEQRTEGLFTVGYDKNTSSSNHIFFNTGVFWEPNADLTGSLMIRPVFGAFDGNTVTGFEEYTIKQVMVYPNPSQGVFLINGKVDQVKVMDLSGKTLPINYEKGSNLIDLGSFPNGIYFLKFHYEGKLKTEKLLLRK